MSAASLTLTRMPSRHDRDSQERPGTVVSNHGQSVRVRDSEQHDVLCTKLKRVPRLVAGDEVRWQGDPRGQGIVIDRLERKSLLSRYKARGKPQAIAANLDQILFVLAVRPRFDQALVDRYLVGAEYQRFPATIVLNKTDLLTAGELASYQAAMNLYVGLGYQVVYCSAKSGDGLDRIRDLLSCGTSIFVGQSGVGKSTLTRHLTGDDSIATQGLARGKHGRHTTSAAVLHVLGSGARLIDSPGVREFAAWHIPATELASAFVELRPYLGECRFRDCTHISEPMCAVQGATLEGHVNPHRLASYRRLFAESTRLAKTKP